MRIYPFPYELMAIEDRVRNLRRERNLQALVEAARRQPEPRPEGRRRRGIVDLVGLLVPRVRRAVKPPNPTPRGAAEMNR